ncbi:unnamed protein product, partial [Closterium sp. NIES-53]
IGRAHSENGVYILDFSIPDCSGDSQELIDLIPLRFEHIHQSDWKHQDGRPWVPRHPHPCKLALHDSDPDDICRDCHIPTASTSAIAGRGLAAIAEAEREAPRGEGLSHLELETATHVVFGMEAHPLPRPASQHLRGSDPWDTIDWGNEPSTSLRTVYGPAPEPREPTFFPGTILETNIPLSTILDREFLALMLTTANGDDEAEETAAEPTQAPDEDPAEAHARYMRTSGFRADDAIWH